MDKKSSVSSALEHLFDWLLIGAGLFIVRVLTWDAVLGKIFCILYAVILFIILGLLIKALYSEYCSRESKH